MMKFHVGIPTYDDFDGLYFTVTSLLVHHRHRVGAISVIDNAPGISEVALKLRAFCKNAGVGYYPLMFPKGPCGAKDMVFRVSTLPTVCLDSHVLLTPGALDALADVWEDGPVLYQGPLMNENGTVHATHLRDVYGTDGMRGTWSTGYYDDKGQGFDAPGISLVDGKPGVYGNPQGSLDTAPAPVEIGAHGCGLLACDPKHWPGFNPKMRGFGGEEWYIQDKMRRRGGRVLLVPKLQWVHRWACSRPGVVSHSPKLWDKARNQVLGAHELGGDVGRVRRAFPSFSESQWNRIVAGAEEDVVACGSCKTVGSVYKTPTEWHTANKTDDRFSHCTGVTIDAGHKFDISVPGVLASGVTDLTVLHPALPNVCGRFGVKWEPGDALGQPAIPCDTLILADHKSPLTLESELKAWVPVVRKRLVIPCCLSSGTLPVVTKFLRENKNWSLYKHGAAWVCITQDDADKMQPPALLSVGSVYKFAKALGSHLSDGMKKVPLEVYENRLDICAVCPSRNGGRCGTCGCVLDAKASMGSEKCPLDKWEKHVS